VLYQGYSIHGNEPSGSNASLLYVYYLAAAQGTEIEEMLDNTVILVDPSFNPDGLNRFAHWANTRKSKNLSTDPNNMEQNEAWPGGRTNHYWFDMNRDWLPLQHPESRGRLNNFHHWKPNVLTDHHEMGTNSTFFFQPGIPSRTHPLTPKRNQDLTGALAEYHADALDAAQRLYYTRESFDDFYYGKGSTYPDINGSIGILFEQASSRSHAQESIHGVLKFPFTIKNQFTTSLSTLRGSADLRIELLEHQREFYREAQEEADNASIKAYVFGSEEDRGSAFRLAEIMRRHQIDVHKLSGDLEANGHTFSDGEAYIVPNEQNQHKLITAMFERRTEFSDSLFYDVSAWTLPYAFNTPFAELDNRQFSNSQLGEAVELDDYPQGDVIGGESEYAYLFEWDEFYAPRALYKLQKAGVRTKVATKPFQAVTSEGVTQFDYGTILVPLGTQDTNRETIHSLIQQAADEDAIDIYASETGLTPEGMDLGSGSFVDLSKPKVAVMAGEGISSYEAGEAWHTFDQKFDIPITLLTMDQFQNADLERYNIIVMASGNYSDLSTDKMKQWVEGGGTLIAYKSAISWAKEEGLANIEFVKEEKDTSEVMPKPYAELSQGRGAQFIGGSIFNTELDLTHPLGYGYNNERLRVFRNSTTFMKKADNAYATPLRYTDDPLASGYISEENMEKIRGTASVVVSNLGSGKVITMTDNPNFRAFWYGTTRLFMNAVFFGDTISGMSAN
jgi:hypothetical protein